MRWRILALLFAARVGLGFQFQTMSAVGGELTDAFGLDNAQIGLMIGLFMAPGLFLALPAGFFGRCASDRVLAGFGLGALALGSALSAMASEPPGIGFGRVVSGVGFLFAMLYFTKMVADWFEGREIATAMSILVMSWPFGIAMGQVGHAWLEQAFGWQVPFQVASVYCLIAALAVFVVYLPPNVLPQVGSVGTARMTRQEWRLIFCAAVAWGIFNAAYVIYLSFGPKLLESLGLSAIAAAGIVSVGSWLMIVSGTLCGQIADRLGRRDVIVTVCMSGAVLSLILLSVPGAGLAASLLFGLVGMAPAGVIMALAGQALRPQVRAFGMGIFFTVYFAIMMATPPIAGAILDRTGHEQGSIVLAMAMFALVVPLSLAFRYFKSMPAPQQEVP